MTHKKKGGGTAITLKDCTRAELIHLIRSHCNYEASEIEFEVLMLRSKQASDKRFREGGLACTAIGEYIDLLKPYENSRASEIPADVFQKSNAAFKQYRRHTRASERYQKQYEQFQRQISQLLGIENTEEGDNDIGQV